MPNNAPNRDWYAFRNTADDAAEVSIYDEIGGGWMGDGTTAKRFLDTLRGITAKTITVRLNSPGGDVFDAFAIYNLLREHAARIVVKVDGLAASAASVVAMAGDEIRMAKNAYMMIHDAWGLAIGNADAMRKYADELEQVTGTIADTYAARTKRDVAEIRPLMSAETWLTADQAKAGGFADAIEGESKQALRVAACVRRFRNTPELLTRSNPMQAEDTPKAAYCTIDGEQTDHGSQADCEAAGGTWTPAESKAETPAATRRRASKAATAAEAKDAAPGAPAEFILACLTKAMTADEIRSQNAERLAVENEQLRAKCAEAEKSAELARKANATATSAVKVTPTAGTADDPDGIRAEWEASADIRAEFGRFETYKAYRVNEKAGRIRIVRRA